MKEKVLVMDNLFSKEVLGILLEEINCMKWGFESSGLDNSYAAEEPNLFFSSETTFLPSHRYLFKSICKKFDLNLGCTRSYVNLYPPKSGGGWHCDEGDVTILLFPQNSWLNAYGGATEFKNEKKVNYFGGRVVIFDAKLEHRAEVNKAPFNRYSIAWKTKKI